MKVCYVIILTVCSFLASAQNQANIWCFGYGIGYDFNYSPPNLLTDGAIRADEGTASICDEEGNLLFYTDGATVWNKNHQVMENGTGLHSFSSTQAALIVKTPEKTNEYLVFTSSANNAGISTKGPNGVFVSKIDMSGDNGLGAVVEKNTHIMLHSSERLAGVMHNNKKDVWVASVSREGEDCKLNVFLITRNGVESVQRFKLGEMGDIGQLKFSNFGAKIACTSIKIPNQQNPSYESFLTIINFNNTTGEISSIVKTTSTSLGTSVVEFSPNSKFLYFNIQDTLVQIEVNEIAAKSVLELPYKKIYTGSSYSHLQLGPDGKIYMNDKTGVNDTSCSVINNPDLPGVLCDYQVNIYPFPSSNASFPIPFGSRKFGSFPSFVQTYIYQPFLIVDSSCVGELLNFKVKKANPDSIQWVLGNQDTIITQEDTLQYTYAKSGIYTVKAILFFGAHREVLEGVTQVYAKPQFSLGKDTVLCESEPLVLEPQIKDYQRIQWFNGRENDTLQYGYESGVVSAEVFNQNCSSSDTVSIERVNCTFTIENLCVGDSTIFVSGGQNADSLSWNFGTGDGITTENTTTTYYYAKGGTYNVELHIHYKGKVLNASQSVEITELPSKLLPDDTTACDATILSVLNPDPGATYRWNTGAITMEINAENSGLYSVQMDKKGCITRDSLELEIKKCECLVYIPDAFTPNNNGLNDAFGVVTDCAIQDYTLTIFNRWGEQIFTGNNTQKGWDGYYKNLPCPSGVYFYSIQYRDLQNKTHHKTGTVTLVK